ncbi:VOC family protein [Luminiphilus sp.]|nr:VOC family protein [Luminiphilus sp.]
MTPQPLRPFHLALPCKDLASTQAFYCDVLGCSLGRTSETWIDLNLYGHQLVFHDCGGETLPERHNPVDRHAIPVPHFGIVLTPSSWEALAVRLRGKVNWILEPDIRFENTPGEQRTLFFRDPNDYALEFKSFADDRFLFEPFDD